MRATTATPTMTKQTATTIPATAPPDSCDEDDDDDSSERVDCNGVGGALGAGEGDVVIVGAEVGSSVGDVLGVRVGAWKIVRNIH
jgi:hypothetical protein